MPGGEVELTFNDESWDDPGSPDPSAAEVIGGEAEAAIRGEDLADKESQNNGGENVSTLSKRWQLTHGRDPPAWADKVFAGIRERIWSEELSELKGFGRR